MPVTQTAKRALRGSKRKAAVNNKTTAIYEVALRTAKKTRSSKDIKKAISLVDRAVKKKSIHKNKGSRIKSSLSKLLKK